MARGRPKGSSNTSKKSSMSPKKKQRKMKKDPNAPKRGKSAYMFWLSEVRPRLTKPGMSVVDVTRAAGVEWAKVKDKTKWEKLAVEDKKRYESESKKYKAGGASKSPKKK